MTSTKVRQLYNYVPGFKNDKDEDWACYLPIKDQQFLRISRQRYLIILDSLDGHKLELKDSPTGSQQSQELAKKIKDLTKQIDEYINTILITIPDLKQKGLEAREKCIEDDLRMDNDLGHSSRQEPTLEDESEVLDGFAAFMPRTDYLEPSAPEPEPSRMDEEQMDTEQEQRDTWLDDLDPEDVPVMEKMRSYASVDSRELIVQALKRLRKREEKTVMLQHFRVLEQSKPKTKPVNQDTPMAE